MAFSFGAPSSGFSFGAPASTGAASASAPSTGFSLGATVSTTPAAPASQSTGFSFSLNASPQNPASAAASGTTPSAPASASTGLSFGFTTPAPGSSSTAAASAAASAAAASSGSSAPISFGATVPSLTAPSGTSTAAPATTSSAAASTGFSFGVPTATGATSSAAAASGASAASSASPSTGFLFSQPGTAAAAGTAASSSPAGFSFGTPAAASSQPAAAGASNSQAGQGAGTAAATSSAQQNASAQAGPQSVQLKQPLPPVQLFLKPSAGSTALVPASYGTKFEDLHPESQKMLLQVEERIRECRSEAAMLGKSERIAEIKGGATSTKHDLSTQVARVRQRLSTVASSISRESASLNKVLLSSYALLQQAEVAVRSFSLLVYRFPQLHISSAMPGDPAAQYRQPQRQELSPYLGHTIERFETQLSEMELKLEELERVLLGPAYSTQDGRYGVNGNFPEGGASTAAAILPSLLRNLHSFLIHVAAQMEPVHEAVEDAKAAFLADRRRRGDFSDPFHDAAALDKERERSGDGGLTAMDPSGLRGGGAAAPGLNPAFMALLPGGGVPLGPGTLGMGMGMGGGTPQMGAAPQPAFGASTPAFGASSSPSFGFGTAPSSSPFGGGSSSFPSFSSSPAFGTPASGGAAPSSLFGMTPPSGSAFGATPSFGTPASSTPSFGAPSTSGSLFGASTPPMFGGTPTPGFGGTGAFGASTGSAFGTPPSISIPGGSGSFGFGNPAGNLTNTKATTTRSRSGRRR